jgi:arylsulfatase A-like enzyme
VGAFYVLALAARAASRAAQADDATAGQTRALIDVVHARFGSEISRMTIAIAASAIVFGAALGLAAGALVQLRDRMSARPARSAAGFGATSLLIIVALHALIQGYAMAASPQLYAEEWYARGGLSRLTQVLVTDVLGRGGVVAVGVLLLLVWLAGPPSSWRAWPGRIAGLLTRPRVRAAAPLVPLLVVGLGVLSFARLPIPSARAAAPRSDHPNILILATDSLRADRIDPRVAPRLARLGDQATRFDRAYVSLPRTFPSWVTLLTGRHPHHHGIRSMFPRWDERAKDFDAVPERFRKAGYSTGVVSDFAGDIFDRIDLGFGSIHAPTFDFRQLIRQRALERQTPLLPVLHSRLGRWIFPVLREMSDAADPDMLADDAIGAIRGAHGQPFFLTVFFSTAHFPYAAPAPYYGRFTRPQYRGRFKYHKPVSLESEAPPDEEDIAQIRGLYDGAVSSVDDAVGRVLGALADEGLAENTIVIVTADHGEMLYENGHGIGHGDHLFGDEATHVPLLILDPRHPGAHRVPGIVRDVDLAPTLYELAGVPAPADLDGRSLAPALAGEKLTPQLAYAETDLWFTETIDGLPAALRLPYPGISHLNEVDAEHGDEVVLQRGMFDMTIVAKHRMVRDLRYKLVYAPTREGVRYLLFDTEKDPGETHDVAAEMPEQVSRLKSELWSWMLKDKRMAEHGGYLVPREVHAPAEAADDAVIRIDAAKAPP